MLASIHERSALLRDAPHLVDIQRFLLPTHGAGLKSKPVLRAALRANDLISVCRNRGVDAALQIPAGGVLSRQQYCALAPGADDADLTGGAFWYDGIMRNSERLTLSFVQSSSALGAVCANYIEAIDLLKEAEGVRGVIVRDRLAQEDFSIRARITLNAAGPWAGEVIEWASPSAQSEPLPWSKVFALVTRQATGTDALALHVKPLYHDRQALARRHSSLIFSIPWQGLGIWGSMHTPFSDATDNFAITDAEIDSMLDLANRACPQARVGKADVLGVLAGLLPADAPGSPAPRKHFRIIDHEQVDGVAGLLSVIGVKYTTARPVTRQALDLVASKLGESPRKTAPRESMPVSGGAIQGLHAFYQDLAAHAASKLGQDTLRRLAENYGTGCRAMLDQIRRQPDLGARLCADSDTLRIEVAHAVDHEMACRLADVVFRRTNMAIHGKPSGEALSAAARIMADRLAWDAERIGREIAQTEAHYRAGIRYPTPQQH
jgi:glycerol-3-phosphate dehydrogenase